MHRLAYLLVFVSGLALPGLTCEVDAEGANLLHLKNFCKGFTIWKTGNADFTLVCPGTQPPQGAVELREYYVVRPRTN